MLQFLGLQRSSIDCFVRNQESLQIMESAAVVKPGVTVIAPEVSSSYRVDPRTENSNTIAGTSPVMLSMMNAGSEKKKRGRPRKYRPDDSVTGGFSPMPISSSVPPARSMSYVEEKRSGVRPSKTEKKYRNKIGCENLDEWDECFTGGSFLPHIITVNTGEDISSKIMEFSQQGPRSVCIISANGVLSKVTMQHPGSSDGTLTYEGQFEIISFCGSFARVGMADSKFGRSGAISLSVSSPDGRVVGGLLAGLMIAASPVKVVVASFLPSTYQEVKPKKHKQKLDPVFAFNASGTNGTISAPNVEKRNSNYRQGTCNTTTESMINWAATHAAESSRKTTSDINISLEG